MGQEEEEDLKKKKEKSTGTITKASLGKRKDNLIVCNRLREHIHFRARLTIQTGEPLR